MITQNQIIEYRKSKGDQKIIKCISNKGPYHDSPTHFESDCRDMCCVLPFTVGKLYTASPVHHNTSVSVGHLIYWNFEDDNGEYHNYEVKHFVCLDKLRIDKLEQLGI